MDVSMPREHVERWKPWKDAVDAVSWIHRVHGYKITVKPFPVPEILKLQQFEATLKTSSREIACYGSTPDAALRSLLEIAHNGWRCDCSECCTDPVPGC